MWRKENAGANSEPVAGRQAVAELRMQVTSYVIECADDALTFEFDSVYGDRVVRKVIVYGRFPNNPDVFNLALGDKQPDGSIDDFARTNNNDMDKIMATVMQSLFIFFERYPVSIVYFTGSTQARTRLYQIIIAKELVAARQMFTISGLQNGVPLPFEPNQSYEAFLLQKNN
ncbi:MAG: hypothetical protein LH609_07970 [Rudanella sp.]|nr:hypothetical protein [Rudanella sp.]